VRRINIAIRTGSSTSPTARTVIRSGLRYSAVDSEYFAHLQSVGEPDVAFETDKHRSTTVLRILVSASAPTTFFFCNRPRPTVETETRSTHRHAHSSGIALYRDGAVCAVLFFFFFQPWRSQQSARGTLTFTSLDSRSDAPSPETPRSSAVYAMCYGDDGRHVKLSLHYALMRVSVIKPRSSHMLVPHDHGHNFFWSEQYTLLNYKT
jgi:hypothetical protein